MGAQFNRQMLLAGGATSVAGGAGASALGFNRSGGASAAADGKGRNGISTAKPKKGGSLPCLWLDLAVAAVVSSLKFQNGNNPTTPSGDAAGGMIGGFVWPTPIGLSWFR